MTASEIYSISDAIDTEIQFLFRELSMIRRVLQDVENAKEDDYDWLDDEATPEQKESYINNKINFAKKMADKGIKTAITGILKEANEIASHALKIIDKEIEY